VTEKEGLRRTVTLAGYKPGMSVDEQMRLGVTLGHEAYRDGVADGNNEAETVAAVKGHTEMAVRMLQDGNFSIINQSLVDDLNAYFDKDADFAEYVKGNYDSSADYLRLVTRSDGTSWFEPDGKKDLTIKSQAQNAEGKWETVSTKTVKMPHSSSEAETLVLALGEERVKELLEEKGIHTLGPVPLEMKGKLLLDAYSKGSTDLAYSDSPLNGYINGTVNSSTGVFEAFVVTAALSRFELSYSAIQGLGIAATAENYKALDRLTFTKEYINVNKPIDAFTLTSVQSVDVYGTVPSKENDGYYPNPNTARDQKTDITVNKQELQGNTVVSDFSLRVLDNSTSNAMVIHNAYALNGRFIDKTGNNALTGGGPWLIHDSQFQVSDGCFIVPEGKAIVLQQALKAWGLEAGDEVAGRLFDASSYSRAEGLSKLLVYGSYVPRRVRPLY
jgi:hypothetical protein